MIVEYTRYKIDEKQRILFERAHEKAGQALSSSSHCLRYELSRCTEDPEHYTFANRMGFGRGASEGLSDQS